MGSEVTAINKGYKQLSKPVTSLTDGHQGIDHVFEKNGKYYIVETKYGNNGLSPANQTTGLPRQMSDEWIVKNPDDLTDNRLYDALGKDKSLYDTVMKNGYKRILAEVSPDGSIKYFELDINANKIGEINF